jgi:hypothetical protein
MIHKKRKLDYFDTYLTKKVDQDSLYDQYLADNSPSQSGEPTRNTNGIDDSQL